LLDFFSARGQELTATDAVHGGDGDIMALQLDHRVVLRMDRNGENLTAFAKVIVGAVGMQTLVAHTADKVSTRIACGVVAPDRRWTAANERIGIIHLDERVAWMLLLRDAEACPAGIEVRTRKAFISVPGDV
jgi:hypothetical protein